MPLTTPQKAGIAFCCCLIILGIILGIVYGGGSDGAASGGAASGGAASGGAASGGAASGGAASGGAAAASPLNTLRGTGQAIQTDEVDISASPPAFTPPTGIDPSKVSYTMTMDINIAQAGPSWRNIMNSGDPDWPPGSTSRRPAIFITGNDSAPANRIHIVHGANEDQNKNIVTSFAATPGTYFTVTWVVDSGKLTTYINGQKDASGTVSATFTWGTPAWKWNAYKTQLPNRTENVAGAIKVKNVYWFNKALSDSEVALLAGGGSSTTSNYMPEPYSWN